MIAYWATTAMTNTLGGCPRIEVIALDNLVRARFFHNLMRILGIFNIGVPVKKYINLKT